MGGATCCGKCLLIGFNIFFAILGLIMLAVGAVVYFLKDVASSLMGDVLSSTGGQSSSDEFIPYFSQIGIPLIACGAVIMILAFVGCCGACYNSKNALIFYATVLGIILLADVITVSVVVAKKDTIKTKVQAEWQIYINKNYDVFATDLGSVLLNLGMIMGKCCGINSYLDFYTANNWNRTYEWKGKTIQMAVPPTCCKLKDGKSISDISDSNSYVDSNCMESPSKFNSNYQTGCWSEMENFLGLLFPYIIAVLVVVLVLQLVLFIFAIVVALKSNNKIDPWRR